MSVKVMKRVYIAGPYNGDNILDCLDHIRVGIKTACVLIKMGYAPFCPFLDYQYRIMDSDITREMYQAQSMVWLEASQAVLLLPGWEKSKGSLAEIRRAKELKIPVFHSFEDLRII